MGNIISKNTSDGIAETIARWCQSNAFIKDKKLDGVTYMRFNNSKYLGQNPSHQITKDCQDYACNKYNTTTALVVAPETPVKTPVGKPNLKFDFYIPNERTAIELCCSVLENELEKDILKAIIDERVIRLIIVATNKIYRDTKYIAERTWNQPARQAMIKTLKGYKVDTNLLWFDEHDIYWV
jgi:hypothetical protein